ncbi:hypothetical protein [Tropicimonas sp.]|uniref:hypothetical protein n=1 Tax=Tropicimonas sp. TaxID=2067044 RepID=UPI003A8946E4
MSDFLPLAVRTELARASRAHLLRDTHMTIRSGGRERAVLRYWAGGFALDSADAAGLRGRVDLYDRGRHLCQALIVATADTEGERLFEFKVETPAAKTAPPADFVRERPEPAGLLPAF